MAQPFKPHTAVHRTTADVTGTVGGVTGVVVGAEVDVVTTNIKGQLDQVRAADVLEWGVGAIEEQVYALFLCDLLAAANIKQRDTLEVLGETYIVMAVKRLEHGLPIDHAEILLERQHG